MYDGYSCKIYQEKKDTRIHFNKISVGFVNFNHSLLKVDFKIIDTGKK